MKRTFFLLLMIAFTFMIQSCKDECDFDSDDPICLETAPTDEECLAYFVRWFYNEESNSCEKIAYSGCSQKGFETKEECESCGCD